ncbi:Ras-related protein Rab-21 like protein [Argiope bruennichi]|uniref:Ras-related protein Rab-21 like protein n=1 Tax=Argiope bruennichi TaxID=94029 RepID=A0A8T0ESX1_ARGBR|nr:Ras-related protein Rab-21 like protein [Argiope bruennichi]
MCRLSFLNKKLNIAGKKVNLAIWDTAGQERFHALGPIYYRDSNGAILVYDITDEDSFNKIWEKKTEHLPFAKGQNLYAASVRAKHFMTSAKQNRGIEELFLDLTRRMIEVTDANDQQANSLGRGSNQRRNVVIVDDEPQQQRSGCCGGG